MFRIRRIYDNTLSIDKDAIAEAQAILRQQFPGLAEREISDLESKLVNPLKHRFKTILFVAENSRQRIKGFAILNHAPDLQFCYLDFISVEPRTTGGIGSALYTRVREEAKSIGAAGMFLECLPDDPVLCRDTSVLRQNKARLRFYERFDVFPIVNTAYETPLQSDEDCPPYLLFDGLDKTLRLKRSFAKDAVFAILTRKYGKRCPKGYITMVLESFTDDPVQLRSRRYTGQEEPEKWPANVVSIDRRIALVVNQRHDIHHVHERGYVEAPVRVSSILKGLAKTDLFDLHKARHFSEKHIKAVHQPQYVEYLKRMCLTLETGKSVYPYVFPIRNAARPPKEMSIRAGYYCIDTFTPLNGNAYKAAKGAVDCALTAANLVLKGYRMGYALVRPPGHHAERRVFGGFCYFNSSAIAADYLSAEGKVTVLDIDYHHGNGSQDIFYRRRDVLTISIHGHPRFAYPYFSGFSEERGADEGSGFNRNYPLAEEIDGKAYHKVLIRALRRIQQFNPRFLVVALGLDTAHKDPTGTWSLTATDLRMNGRLLGSLHIPIVVVQEGGYRSRTLGSNARNFFEGLWQGMCADRRFQNNFDSQKES